MFDLPATAQPGKDVPVAQDELGRTVYRTFTGEQYTMPEPPRMAPRAAGPMQGPLAYASPQRMAEMRAYAEDLRRMQGSYSAEDIAAGGYSPMEIAALSTAKRPAMPFSQEADRDRQRAPADVLQEPDLTMRYKATALVQNALIEQVGMDTYNAGMYARRIMGDPNASGILESLGLIDIASMLGGAGSLAAKGVGMAGRAVAASPAALSGMFNVEEGTQTAQRGYQEGSALQTGLGAVQAVAGMAEMFPASKLIAEGISRNMSRMDPNTLFSVFGPPMPPQPLRAPDTGAGSGRPPLTFDEVARAMQEAPQGNFQVTRQDASQIFGAGSERVRYTDPQSNGTIEVLVRPDGSASVLELEVPEANRGQGIGQKLQEQVMKDFPVMGGQVSSKAAATTAYRLGRRPPGKPNATLEDVFAEIDDMSSVNMVSPGLENKINPKTPSIRAYHGSPHSFEKFEMSKIGTGEGAQAYGQGLYFAEAEDTARAYRNQLSPDQVTIGGQAYTIPPKSGILPREVRDALGLGDTGADYTQEVYDAMSNARFSGTNPIDEFDEISAARISELEEDIANATGQSYKRETARFLEEEKKRLASLRSAMVAKNVSPFGTTGRMYEVNINANPEDFINYDAPLSAQSLNIQRQFGYVPRPTPQEEVAAYELAKRESPNDIGNHPAVQDMYRRESGANAAERNFQRQVTGGGIDEAARISLSESGIPGVRYLDAGSRYTPSNLPDNPIANEARAFLDQANGDAAVALRLFNGSNPVERFATTERDEVRKVIEAAGRTATRNYVVFDENLINIVRKYGIAGAAAMLGVSAVDVEEAIAQGAPPSQRDQLVVGPQ